MSIETLTDEHIAQLLTMPKSVENARAKEKIEGKHLRRDYSICSEDGVHRFTLFTRQSTKIPDGFSAGLLWHAQSGESIILIRCNGSDHPHPNVLERERIEYQCHIHVLTERYITAGRKGEGFAEAVQTYHTLAGALHELACRAHIAGLNLQADTQKYPDLFGEMS